jgi:diaminopimelate decarboxylase
MDHFTYHEGGLHCEDVAARAIADAAGTPCYVYSRATLLEHYERLATAFAPLDPLICFSVKSCSNLEVIRTLAARGAGMDLVSGGELHRARLAGVEPGRCVYAGVGKTDDEIRMALRHGVGWFNVESEEEFENISVIAREMECSARAALRVNPDVDPRTHRYTTTGKKETKFGVDIERARRFFRTYGKDPHCRLRGVHLHIGSPVYRVEAYVESIRKALDLVEQIEADAQDERIIDMIDLGGGFGADYESDQSPLAADYADQIVPLLRGRAESGVRIVLEPGRTIAANAGVMLTRVLYQKRSGDKTFVICDGGMQTLLRPSHYDAFHFIWPCEVEMAKVPPRRAREVGLPDLITADIVGPLCETGDFLALDRAIPPVRRGDVLAVFAAGAYGMAMANRYNASPLPAEIIVDGSEATIIRHRERYDDLTAHERDVVSLTLPSGGRKGVVHDHA